ncbi:MAG TPA: phospholipase D family protein [Actinophytocola sp.]|uniref:phospholipase D-like domain-containing protein n=1 Tax=Actinophytocola sp. TaxID=1872138 RepID=UPI002DBF6BBE|nr:phospholipase D family protein [Actinophytocola sp.]HEU5473498.1 phospholipase D family protein [Actinophytocola sp.]
MATVRALVDKVDERVGDGLERVLCQHHRRRLTRLGWRTALEPGATGWFSDRAPVRDGNRVDVLIDGEEALPAIRAAIEGAESSVHIANWHASPDFRLTREPGAPTLRELLAQTARRVPVRLLLWGGPPVPVFEPTRKRVRTARAEFTRDSAVRCVLDTRERTMHCHHEKLVIVDDTTAFVGGLDFTALQGDRHDSRDHPADRPLGWHDVTTRVTGPAVADVAEHFRARWNEVTGDALPAPEPPRPTAFSRVQLVRTVPERTYEFAPHGDFSILDVYRRALCSAQHLIYLENQFLWSPEIAEILIDKLRDPPDDRFRVVLVLPRKPSNGADTTRGQLGRLVEADDGGRRLLATTITAHDGDRSATVYVHAKTAIVDDEWLTIGSANLNEHSLFNDTEVNIVTDDAALARDTRLRLWSEHLQRPRSEIDGDPTDVVDTIWRPTAEDQADRTTSGARRTHRLTLLPGISRRAGRLQGPLRGLLVDG